MRCSVAPRWRRCGVPATGSSLHLAGAMLEKQTGIDLRAVAYKGGGPLLTDLLGGQVPVSFNVLTEVLPHVQSEDAVVAPIPALVYRSEMGGLNAVPLCRLQEVVRPKRNV